MTTSTMAVRQPDGYLDITLHTHGVEELSCERIFFKDIRGWKHEARGVFLLYDRNYLFIPAARIYDVHVTYNSPEWQEYSSQFLPVSDVVACFNCHGKVEEG